MPDKDKFAILHKIRNKEISHSEGMRLIEKLYKTDKPEEKMVSASPGKTSIAVIGMSGKFPGAAGISEFWENLKKGTSSVGDIPAERWKTRKTGDGTYYYNDLEIYPRGGFLSDVDLFDPQFFNISPHEARLMDPRQRIFLEEAWKAIEDAGYSDKELAGSKCGVFIGCGKGDYPNLINKNGISDDAYAFIGNENSILSARLSYYLNLKGVSIAVDTACSSSLIATALACENITNGICDMALAGGIMLMSTPEAYIQLGKTGMLSEKGECLPFDNNADGFVPGEGVGVIVLKRLDVAIQAKDNIYAVISAFGFNQDGKSNGITSPNAASQKELECEIYEKFNINPETITCIETHGTGTPLGDPIEFQALTDAFGKYTSLKNYCAIGSVKANIGHSLFAAGIISLIKVILCLKNKVLPPSAYFKIPNKSIDFDGSPFYINQKLSPWEPENNIVRRAAISGFGFSGSNCHMVVEEPPVINYSLGKPLNPYHIIPLSAKTQTALDKKIEDLRVFMSSNTDIEAISIADIACTLQVGRSHFNQRAALIVKDTDDLKYNLGLILNNRKCNNYFKNEDKNNSEIVSPELTARADQITGLLKDHGGVNNNEEYKDLLSELASLYVKGCNPTWDALYKNNPIKRVSLPAYPFDGEHYWIEENDEHINKRIQNIERLAGHESHPFVGVNCSTLKEQKYEKTFYKDDPVLKDHQINGQVIFPATAYLEMMRAVSQHAAEYEIRDIESIVILSPMDLKKEGNVVTTTINPENDGSLEIEIASLNGDKEKILHFTGKTIPDTGNDRDLSVTNKIEIDKIKKCSSYSLKKEDIYDLFHSQGFDYGTGFQTIQELFVSDNEILSYLNAESYKTHHSDKFILNPAVLDGALQSAIGLLIKGKGDGNIKYVPFMLNDIEIHGTIPLSCYAYIRKNKPSGNGNMQSFNIKVTDISGNILVAIDDFSVRPLENINIENINKNTETGDLYFIDEWKELAGHENNKHPSAKSPGHKNLVLFDENELLYNELKDSYINSYLVKPDEKFRIVNNCVFCLPPGDEQGFSRLVYALSKGNTLPFDIVINWMKFGYSEDKENVKLQMDKCLFSIFHITQQFIKSKINTPINILVVNNEDELNPICSSLSGFSKTLHLENPDYYIKILTLKEQYEVKKITDIVLSELSENKYIEVYYEADKRYRKIWKEIDIDNNEVQKQKKSIFKNDGTYIITGGAGEIGLVFARYIAESVNARIILLGRSRLNTEKEKRINEIKTLGSTVVYYPVDISNKDELKHIIQKIKKGFNEITGIIHSAGVIKDGFILNKRSENIHEVIAPKVYGTINLDELTKNEKLDFFILFSSISAVYGNAGQADYAFANSFLSNYSYYRNGLVKQNRRSGRTLSVNWPLWSDGGMKVDIQSQEEIKDTIGMLPVTSPKAIQMFKKLERVLYDNVIVINGFKNKIRKSIENINTTRSYSHSELKEAGNQVGNSIPGPEYNEIESALKKCISEVTGLDIKMITDQYPFEKYGIDSIMIVSLNKKLENYFGKLPKTLLFEYQNLKELTGYFITNNKPVLLKSAEKAVKSDKPGKNISTENTKSDKKYHLLIQKKTDKSIGDEEIAIIGLAGKYPMANSLDDFWENLKTGKDCISEIPGERWNYKEYYDPGKENLSKSYSKWGGFIDGVDKFDALFFNISPKEAELIDPQERLFLEIAWQTLENGGYSKNALWNKRVGVFVGVMNGQYQLIESEMDGKTVYPVSSYSSVANRVSYFFNFQGPSIAVDSMCSSSLTAIHLACDSIRKGESIAAIAGGVNVILHHSKYVQLSQGGFASTDGRCRSFGEGGDGYVPGEGAGAVLLKPLNKAIEDKDYIYGVIKASSINHGGKTSGYTVPNPNLQAELILESIEKSGINARSISYIEAHGTGTALGDPIEIAGLMKAFNKYCQDKQFCSIGSVKSNIGHLESAAGIAGLTKVLLQMKNKQLMPSIHSDQTNLNIDFADSPFYLQKTLSDWKKPEIYQDEQYISTPRRAGISSFGAGGANAHIIVEEYHNQSSETDQYNPQIIVLSSPNKEKLIEYSKDIVKFIKNNEDVINLSDIAFTLQTGRVFLEERIALIVTSTAELYKKLGQYCEGQENIENVFTGTAGNEKTSDKEGINYSVKELIKNKELESISRLWISGAEIKWEWLYEKHKPNRIPLPSSPLLKERYWVTPKKSKSTFLKLHPLIDINTSTIFKQEFTSVVRDNDFYLNDHVVFGQKIIPGAVYIEIARATAELSGASNVFKIAGIQWMQPFIKRNEEQKLKISLSPHKTVVNYEICEESPGEEKKIISKGEIHYNASNDHQRYADISVIKDRCNLEITGETCYQNFTGRKFEYGTRLQSIKNVHFNSEEALALLELPVSLSNEWDQYAIHPAILDGAFQSITVLLKKEETDKTYLPFSLDKLEVLNPMKNKCYAHIKQTDPGFGDGNNIIKHYNIEITDETGLVLLSLENLCLKSTGEFSLSKNKHSSGLLYFKYDWEKFELSDSIQPAKDNLIVFYDENVELYKAILNHNKTPEKGSIVFIRNGVHYHETNHQNFEINYNSHDDYNKLIRRLQELKTKFSRIIYCPSEKINPEHGAFIRSCLNKGIYPLFHISKCLIENKTKENIKILYAYGNDNPEARPFHAAITGFARTLLQENPNIVVKTIEFEASFPSRERITGILTELEADTGKGMDIRYSNGKRFAKKLNLLDLNSVPPFKVMNATIKEGGCYLITGGTGRLGLIIAGFIAENKKTKLILTGRSVLNTEKKERIVRLEKAGAEVTYFQSDISDQKDVEELILQVKKRYGELNGIIHAAGVTRDAYILKKQVDDLDAVFKSKVYGTVNLDKATINENLDFFIMFSSLTGVTGNFGQGDYAYANSFLDNFTGYREELRLQGKRNGRTLSVDWPLWDEGGMQIPDSKKELFRTKYGILPLSTSNGLSAFQTAFNSQNHQVIVLETDNGGVNDLNKTILEFKNTENPKVSQIATGENDLQTIVRIENYLKNIIAKEIKLSPERINSNHSFDRYGIESLMVLNINEELENCFGELSKTLLFEYRSIADLAGYFIKHHASAVNQKFKPSVKVNTHIQTALYKSEMPGPKIEKPFRFLTNDTVNGKLGSDQKDIAIIGLSGIYPGAKNLDEFWENLVSGKDCITEIPKDRWNYRQFYDEDKNSIGKMHSKWGGFIDDVDKFDPLFFNISPREAALMDPQERLFLQVVWQTLEDSGYTRASLSDDTVGVFAGVMYGQYQFYESELDGNLLLPGSSYAAIANRVSYYFDFKGPSLAVDTMCSSSLAAIHLACESINRNECSLAIAGGVNLTIHPNKYLQLSQGKFMSDDGKCRSFGEGGDGYVPGEGVGALLLKPFSKAIEDNDRIYGIIKGSSMNHGGRTTGFTVPNPNAQTELIVKAIEKSRVNPESINYIEAHGTGTSLGDPIEITGLQNAFGNYTNRKNACAVGSVKSNIGHLESAAGIAAITKVLLQMKYKKLVPSIHSEKLNPNINFSNTSFYVQRELSDWKNVEINEEGKTTRLPRRAGISSFGAGGSNAHIILEEYCSPVHEPANDQTGNYLILLSAKNKNRLLESANNLIRFLETSGKSNIVSIKTENNKEISNWLSSSLSKILGVDVQTINEENDLTDYGCNNIEFKQLTEAIYSRFGVEIKTHQFAYLSTIKKISQYILEREEETAINTNKQGIEHYALQDIAYTLQVGREALEERLAVVVSDKESLLKKLTRVITGTEYVQDAYSGNSNVDKNTIEDIFQGTEASDFINAVIENNNIHKLARLWALGLDIDWRRMYATSNNKPHIVSLPNYPFTKERCWVSESPGHPGSTHRFYHPLIDSIDYRQSLDGGLTFKKTFKKEELIVRDHKVQGKSILPGVAYLEMALRAFSLAGYQNSSVSVSKLLWIRPLIVDSDETEVSLRLFKKDDHINFEIKENNLICANGVLENSIGSNPYPFQKSFVEDFKSTALNIIGNDLIYNEFNDIGIHYGKYFQSVKRIFSGTTEAIGELKLPPEYINELNTYLLHPALVDGAIQAICALRDRKETILPMLPFSVEKVEILSGLKPECYVYIKNKNNNIYDISIFNDNGAPCVNFIDFCLKEINDPLSNLLYYPTWKPYPLNPHITQDKNQKDTNLKKNVLVFYNDHSDGLENAFEKMHQHDNVFKVQLSGKTSGSPDITSNNKTNGQNEFNSVIAGMKEIHIIYFLGGIQKLTNNLPGDEVLKNSQAMGITNLFKLIKSLDTNNFANKHIELNVLTNNVWKIHEEDQIIPYSGSLYGFSRSTAKEYKQWNIQCIDIDINKSSVWIKENAAESLKKVMKCSREAKGEDIVVRDNYYYKRELKPISLSAPKEQVFRHNGIYLILGGAGGIGLTLSSYLSEHLQARLILIGRKPLNKEQKEKISEIESKGGKVMYLQADGSNIENMRTAVEKAKAHFGNINGVIHSAIVLKDKTISMMDEVMLWEVLNPKITASFVLAEIFSGDNLDFMMFFSSAQSFFGNTGQTNYAAGCSFKDAFALYLESKLSFPVKIINWGYWGSTGIVADEKYKNRFLSQGIGSIDPKEGIETIIRLLGNPVPQVMSLKADKQALNNMGILADVRHKLTDQQGISIIEDLSREFENSTGFSDLPVKTDALQKIRTAFEKLNEYSRFSLLIHLQKQGIFNKNKEAYNINELREKLKVIPRYNRLYLKLLDILAETGMIEINGGNAAFTQTGKLRDNGDYQLELIKKYPETEPYLSLLNACINHLSDILQGSINATDIIFPESSMKLVEKIYRGNELTDFYNKIAASVVYTYCSKNIPFLSSGKNKVKIIEIGAGTGGTTKIILEKIKEYGADCEYHYSDISSSFINYGKDQYGKDFPFMKFLMLDIEKTPGDQGLQPGTFDIAVASNVLHATSNISATLQNLKLLLKKNGILVINEVTKDDAFVNLTFGLLDGWWKFNDEEKRLSNSPLLNTNSWTIALKNEGFKKVFINNPLNESTVPYDQHIIVAESDGIIKINGTYNKKDLGPGNIHVQNDKNGLEKRTVKQIPFSISEKAKTNIRQNDKTPFEKVEKSIIESLEQVLQVNRKDLDSNAAFVDIGIDSILAVEVVNKINHYLKIDLKTIDVFNYSSIKQLTNHILKNFNEKLIMKDMYQPADFQNNRQDDHATYPEAEFKQAYDQNSSDSEEEYILTLFRKIETGELSVDQVNQLI